MDVKSTVDYPISTNKSAQATLFRNVYLWMTLALIITASTAFAVASTPNIIEALLSNMMVFYVLIFAELGLVWFLVGSINKLSFTTATLMFIVYSILNGVTLSIILLVYTGSSVALTFFITAGTFGAMALFGTITKKDLSSWGNILFMALIGIIIASVANWFFKSDMLSLIISYIGVILFVGLTAYDAQKIKRMIQEHGGEVNDSTQKMALLGALSLYLDFINLFLFLLRILGSRK